MMKHVILISYFLCSHLQINAQDLQQHVFNIYFKTNIDQLSQKNKNKIRQSLLDIGSQNIREIRLKGHADSDANDSFNIKLSQRRAEDAYRYLLTQGVPEGMISKESFGESEPTSELKSLNRRVEVTVVYDYGNFKFEAKGRRFYVKGIVKDFNSTIPLSTSFVIEDNKLNVFKHTNGAGVFGFAAKPGKDLSLTFSKENYLNESVILKDPLFRNAKNDTIYLEILLKPIEVVEKIVFDNIFFYSDSDSLKPQSIPDLNKLLALLRSDKNLYVEIQGHMNCPLSRPQNIYQKRYNHELSHKRAKAIYKYLLSHNIPARQLTFKGMSNSFMIYPEPKDLKEADKNKRVEVWKLKVIETN